MSARISKVAKSGNLEKLIEFIGKADKKHSIKELIKCAFLGACSCEGENEEVINFLLNMIMNNYVSHELNDLLSRGLKGACIAKNKPLIEKLINIGARKFNIAFLGACEGGNLEIIEMIYSIIEKNFKYSFINWYAAIISAIRGGHLNLIDTLICYITTTYDICMVYKQMLVHKRFDLAKKILKYKRNANASNMLNKTIQYGNEELIELIVKEYYISRHVIKGLIHTYIYSYMPQKKNIFYLLSITSDPLEIISSIPSSFSYEKICLLKAIPEYTDDIRKAIDTSSIRQILPYHDAHIISMYCFYHPQEAN